MFNVVNIILKACLLLFKKRTGYLNPFIFVSLWDYYICIVNSTIINWIQIIAYKCAKLFLVYIYYYNCNWFNYLL